MSVEKLVNSTQLDSDLTSVANAIRAKGETSESLAFPSGFVSAIQAIPTSSVTLPTSINKIAGGSFTPSIDTTAGDYSIAHDMGEAPIGFVIWCDTIEVATTGDSNIIRFAFLESHYNDEFLSAQQYQLTVRNNAVNSYVNGVAETAASGFVSSNFIKANVNNIHYLSGHEYKWLAWV